MKTKKQVLADNTQYKKIINAVVNQIGGMEQMENLVTHPDMSAGFPGFTYYTDTHAFAMRNRKQIVELLENMAEEFGEDVVNMVSNFGVFKNSPMDADDKKQLYQYLGGGRPEKGTITNVMAWFAGEEVARMFED